MRLYLHSTRRSVAGASEGGCVLRSIGEDELELYEEAEAILDLLYTAMERYGEAQSVLEQALAMRERLPGLEHPDYSFLESSSPSS